MNSKNIFENKVVRSLRFRRLIRSKGFYIGLICFVSIVGATAILTLTYNISTSIISHQNGQIGMDVDKSEAYDSDLFATSDVQSDKKPAIAKPRGSFESIVGQSATPPGDEKPGGLKRKVLSLTETEDKADKKDVGDKVTKKDTSGQDSKGKKDRANQPKSVSADNLNSSSANKSSNAASTVNTDTTETMNKSVTTNSGQNADLASRDSKSQKYIMPVSGGIIFDYSIDKLVYSKTLDEWRTHSGVDLSASRGTVVKAVLDGVVSDVKNDPKLGILVIVDNIDGLRTVYANLASDGMVVPNQKIKQGDVVGCVGESASFESLEPAHLHFEVLKNSEPIDPKPYLPDIYYR